MTAVGYGRQRGAASTLKLYLVSYDIVSWRLVLPVTTMEVKGDTLVVYVTPSS
jgi:hypothetical protein